MPRIEKLFYYDIADDYLLQTNSQGKVAEWTYRGPDRIWVEVNEETGALIDTGFKTIEEDGPNTPVAPGERKVEVNCDADPLFCCLVGADEEIDHETLPQHTEVLPNGDTYSRPANPIPDHTYEPSTAVYNFETGEWSYDWHKTWVTWDQLIEMRDRRLVQITIYLNNVGDTLPDDYRATLEQYKQDLEDVETTWAGYEADHQCIKVVLPKDPREKEV
jgi:hypothetical protein